MRLDLYRDLCRLARFGANITDAHSCFIFLPTSIFENGLSATEQKSLRLSGFHSLNTNIKTSCSVEKGVGLIGWVAKHNRSIHVSPFERDSRILGMYEHDCELKSFMGIPVPLKTRVQEQKATGVIACDSKKSYAFSKLQGKLLEDLAAEVANTIFLSSITSEERTDAFDWISFAVKAEKLISSLGVNAVEVMRIQLKSFRELEKQCGTRVAAQTHVQLQRLIDQTLPPHFPVIRLSQGDLIVVLDNMMSSFYENKFHAICSHVSSPEKELSLAISRCPMKRRGGKPYSLEEAVTHTAQETSNSYNGDLYEYRTA